MVMTFYGSLDSQEYYHQDTVSVDNHKKYDILNLLDSSVSNIGKTVQNKSWQSLKIKTKELV
jgi:hypothetical protein